MNTTDRLSLLLVEDSPADVFLVKQALREEGLDFTIEIAEDGEAAIRLLDRIEAGLIPAPTFLLLDINVPRKNGLQVLQRARQIGAFDRVPVVMCSSSDSPAERQCALDLGATEYFCKPSSLAGFLKLGGLVRRLHLSACGVSRAATSWQ